MNPVFVCPPMSEGIEDITGNDVACYDFEHRAPFSAVQVIKACNCLDYQSCEHDGWEASEAKSFLDSLISAACHRLPGYDAAEWGPPKNRAASKTAFVRIA